MGTRIEPTISNHPGDEPAENLETVAAHGDAENGADPTLAELAALENEVDNWLHAPVKPEPAAMEPEAARAELRDAPASPQTPPQPPAPPQPAARSKRPVMWWVLGAGAFAAIAGAAVLLDEPATPVEPARAITTAAAPAPAPAPVAQAPAPAATRPELVFLEQPAATPPKAAEPRAKPAATEGAAVKPQQRATADTAVAAPAAPAKAKKTEAVRKAKPVKKPAPPPQTREAGQRTQTWPRDRRASDAQRVEDARAECRARSRDPAACRIRVCDVLGSSHPACRE